jgi:hypothetical protein
MGCGINKAHEKSGRNTHEFKSNELVFRISDMKRMKNKGLFLINEVNSSEEFSFFKEIESVRRQDNQKT